jgi:dodecin
MKESRPNPDALRMTGRDGGADLATQVAALNESAQMQHAYRVIELVGTSDKSITDAIRMAIARAHKTLRHLRWFEVVRTSGQIVDGEVTQFQVTLKVGFTLEGGEPDPGVNFISP